MSSFLFRALPLPIVVFVLTGLCVGDRLDSGFRRADRRAVLTRVRITGLKTDADVGTGCFGFHPPGHHSVFALIFRNDCIRRVRAQSPQGEGRRIDPSSRN